MADVVVEKFKWPYSMRKKDVGSNLIWKSVDKQCSGVKASLCKASMLCVE